MFDGDWLASPSVTNEDLLLTTATLCRDLHSSLKLEKRREPATGQF